jgi:hypothetical protein
MKSIVFLIIFAVLLFCNNCFSQFAVEDYYEYMVWRNPMDNPIYGTYLRLATLSSPTQFYFYIRQGSSKYPGDYFYPPDAFTSKEFVSKDLHMALTSAEIKNTSEFLEKNISLPFSDSLILSSLKGYSFEYPNGPHLEPYTMLAEADTVYVISGWLGKFLSFYRAVPGNFRLTVPRLMDQLDKLTPLAKEIYEKRFRHESDSLNYLWEYVDNDKMFRIRNYLMKATLPPNPPDSPAIYYNLIEITKFQDKDVMP